MKRIRMPLLSVIMLALMGCATAPGNGDDPASPARRQHNRIGIEEIQQTQSRNAYELIRGLRPNWLDGRGAQSLTSATAGQVMVYLDGTRAGSAEILRQIATQDVQSAQFLSPTEAGARYGLNHTGGAILITTRRQ